MGQEAAAFGENHSFRTAKEFIHWSWTVPQLPAKLCQEQVMPGEIRQWEPGLCRAGTQTH